jgi:hypothetical protein
LTYHLEALGDEKFQQLCQALMARSFRNVQCLPVGQPDGGRDAFQRKFAPDSSSDSIIFQVKYSRNPSAKEERDAVAELIRSERDKVQALIMRGAQKYYFLTNVSGTSHLGGGSVDRVNEQLSRELGIEAYCWWRDDIERRLDDAPQIKWSYPDLMKGTDLLQFLIGGEGEDTRRRTETLKSFMAHQFRQDDRLKFKQIDLHKSIVDLFVDVPVRVTWETKEQEKNWRRRFSVWFSDNHKQEQVYGYSEEERGPDALEVLVNKQFAGAVPLVVIEGAPGQGKSTVTQYLCQVHRMKLLERPQLRQVAPEHQPGEARIPIRLDLRDYAAWIDGRDPFSTDPSTTRPPSSSPVLEAFISAQISRHTGSDFSVNDLVAVARSSQILVVLDGFDEVADVSLRNRLVAEVSDAADRIRENAISAQLVVTSRPAAFANSPGFPRDEWQHLHLTSLTNSHIVSYAQKSLDAREIEGRERIAVMEVLETKLEQSHIRDLARNPMQLAILLALISVRGASLPEKRTALYDSYVDIFLNREAEKSHVVRDHRQLLLKIHRFLAWRLQLEAESNSGNGSISENRLKSVLQQFLEEGGHPTQLVDQLFSGVVERVFVLVSRIQGTYEFEVQPLREYFAARYLYDTAPYSPPGEAKPGTLPERFDALARNFYWLNVTRFFAGCYSSGELASILYGIKIIQSDGKIGLTQHLPMLIVNLLQDHVFADEPLLGSELVGTLELGGLLDTLLASRGFSGNPGDFYLPEGRPRDKFIEMLKALMEREVHVDRLIAASNIMSLNTTLEERVAFWFSVRDRFEIHRWHMLGWWLGVPEGLDQTTLREVLAENLALAKRYLVTGGFGKLDAIPGMWPRLLDASMLSEDLYVSDYRGLGTSAEAHFVVAMLKFKGALWGEKMKKRDAAFHTCLTNAKNSEVEYDSSLFLRGASSFDDARVLELAALVDTVLCTNTQSLHRSWPLWMDYFNLREDIWGGSISLRCDVLKTVANLDFTLGKDILSRSGSTYFSRYSNWRFLCFSEPSKMIEILAQLEADSSDFLPDALAAALIYMGNKVVLSWVEEIGGLLENLNDENWTLVSSMIAAVPSPVFISDERLAELTETKQEFSWRLLYCLSRRIKGRKQSSSELKVFARYDGSDPKILERQAMMASIGLLERIIPWGRVAQILKKAYGADAMGYFPIRYHSTDVIPGDDLEMCLTVCSDAKLYPLELLNFCQAMLAQEIGEKAVNLEAFSSSKGWFS